MTSEDARPWPLENMALPPLCLHHPRASLAAMGLGGRGGGIWVSVAWGLAVWGVCAVSGYASASVLGLLTAAGTYQGWRCPFAQAFVRGIYLVVSSLCVCVCVCVCQFF